MIDKFIKTNPKVVTMLLNATVLVMSSAVFFNQRIVMINAFLFPIFCAFIAGYFSPAISMKKIKGKQKGVVLASCCVVCYVFAFFQFLFVSTPETNGVANNGNSMFALHGIPDNPFERMAYRMTDIYADLSFFVITVLILFLISTIILFVVRFKSQKKELNPFVNIAAYDLFAVFFVGVGIMMSK